MSLPRVLGVCCCGVLQLTRTQNVNTKVGSVGATSKLAQATNLAAILNPLLGMLANSQNNLNVFTSSTDVAAAASTPLTISDTDSTGWDTKSTYGAYLPGAHQ